MAHVVCRCDFCNSREFCNSGFRLRKIFSNDWEVMEACEPKEILSFPATFRKTKRTINKNGEKTKTRLLWTTSDKNVKNLSKSG